MTEAVIIVCAFTLVGAGGFLMGYGWAAWLERWEER